MACTGPLRSMADFIADICVISRCAIAILVKIDHNCEPKVYGWDAEPAVMPDVEADIIKGIAVFNGLNAWWRRRVSARMFSA